jgi:hypothetical protein
MTATSALKGDLDIEMKVRQLSHLTSIVSEWATDRSMYPETDDPRSDQLSRLMFAVDEIAQKAADLDKAFHSTLNAAFKKRTDPVFAAIERSRAAWLALGSVLTQADEAGEEPDEGELAAAHAVNTEALDNLLKTTPETLAGARAAIAWLVKVDDGSVPERSGKYMETLLRSPVFAA